MALPVVYCDTSVWLKLYVQEAGTAEIRQIADENRLISSALLLTEAYSALKRKKTNRELSDPDFNKVTTLMESDISAVHLIAIGDPQLKKSRGIVLHTEVGTLDALHIASAITFQELSGISTPFITADRRQHDCARQAGLQVRFIP